MCRNELESQKFSLKLHHFSLQNKINETEIYIRIFLLKKFFVDVQKPLRNGRGPTAISQIFKLAKNRCEMAVVCEMAVLRNGSGDCIEKIIIFLNFKV